jgi:hypothetical protein
MSKAEASKSLNRVAGLQQDLFTVLRQNLPDLKDIDEQEAWVNRTETFRNNALSVFSPAFRAIRNPFRSEDFSRPISQLQRQSLCISHSVQRKPSAIRKSYLSCWWRREEEVGLRCLWRVGVQGVYGNLCKYERLDWP